MKVSSRARRSRELRFGTWLLVAGSVVWSCGGAGREAALPLRSENAPPLIPATAEEVLRAVRRPGAAAVLVNVWATWCTPCREEFPELLRLARAYRARGLRLILVSADFDTERQAVEEFLAHQGVDFPTYWKRGADMDFIDRLSPKWSGALPATFIYDRRGVLRLFWEGKTTYEKFAAGVEEAMKPPAPAGGGGRRK
jgi:thiol-disulfide isomerase/thioredoxin